MTLFIDEITPYFLNYKLTPLNDFDCLIENSRNLSIQQAKDMVSRIGYDAIFSETRILGNLNFTLASYSGIKRTKTIPLDVFERLKDVRPMRLFLDEITPAFPNHKLIPLNDFDCLIENSHNLSGQKANEMISRIGYRAIFSEEKNRILGSLYFTLPAFSGMNCHKTIPLDVFKRLRAASPISKIAICFQSKLYKRLRESRNCQYLVSVKHKHHIFKFEKNEPGKVKKAIAYYKERKLDCSDDRGIVEQLVWDFAVIAGWEEFFIPATATSVRSQNILLYNVITASKKCWNKDRTNLINKDLPTDLREGSFQLNIEGMLLRDYLGLFPLHRSLIDWPVSRGQNRIPRPQLIKASLIAALMGLFDAHSNNIIINKEGGVIFCDTTCHMPRTNGMIRWGGPDSEKKLRSSFRSGLVELNGSYAPFSAGDRELMTEEIEKFKSKMPILKDFYNHKNTQSRLRKLPKKWFNFEDSWEALEERVRRLQDGIANPAITNLCELSLISQPYIKFIAAITCFFILLCEKKIPMQSVPSDHAVRTIITEHISSLGYYMINTCFKECYMNGFNPLTIKNYCDNSNLSFHEIIKWLCQYNDRVDVKVAERDAKQLLSDLQKNAKTDFKDT